jgi:hypothetical protein
VSRSYHRFPCIDPVLPSCYVFPAVQCDLYLATQLAGRPKVRLVFDIFTVVSPFCLSLAVTIYKKTELVGLAATVLIYIWWIICSNLRRDIRYLDSDFFVLFFGPSRRILGLSRRPPPSSSYQITSPDNFLSHFPL